MFLQLDRSKQSTPAKFHPRNSNQKTSNQEIPPRRFPCIKQQSSTYQTDLRIPPKNRQHKTLPPRKFHLGDSRHRTASKVHPQNSTQDICETRGFHRKNFACFCLAAGEFFGWNFCDGSLLFHRCHWVEFCGWTLLAVLCRESPRWNFLGGSALCCPFLGGILRSVW